MSDDMPELQDREEVMSLHSHDSEDGGPSSPGEADSPHELKSSEQPESTERVSSMNCPESSATAVLSSRELWQLFDAIGTEMIVTRRGRRMFPAIKVELYDLKPDVSYILLMDMVPVDKYRYKYNAGWVRCFEEECAPTRLYIHPDSPTLGSHWTSVVINFYKLKLTNNQLDKQGHIIVNSMHRYQPRLHIVESDDINSFNWDTRQTFIFPGTQFTTVTAYQNDKITQLKIQTNPFAKGFRTPFSRCRSRNPPGICTRFTLRSSSCSDSGVEDPPHPSPSSLPHSSPTSLFSPRLLLPSHDSSHLLMYGHDSTRLVVQGQDAPRVLLPGWDLQRLAVSAHNLQQLPEQDAQRVLFAGQDEKPVLLPGQDGKTCILTGQDGQKVLVAGQNSQKLILPTPDAPKLPPSAQHKAQVTRLLLGQDGQKIVLPAKTAQNGRRVLQGGQNIVLQHQDSQKLILAGQDGQMFLLSGQDSQKALILGADPMASQQDIPEIAGKKRRRPEEGPAGRKLACFSTPQAMAAASEPPLVLMYRPVLTNQQPQLVSGALLQPQSSHAGKSTTYTIVAAPREPSASSPEIVPNSQPQVPTSRPLTATPLILTSSPHTLPSAPHTFTSSHTATSTTHTSSPLSSTTSSPTVVNGLVHLKSSEMKPVQVIMSSSEGKKPPMDISCLTKEGVVRTQTPPPLLQVQNRNKLAQKVVGTQQQLSPTETSNLGDDLGGRTQQLAMQPKAQQQTNTMSLRQAEVSKGHETVPRQKSQGVRQEVVLVQPTGMQRVLVIGEKGEVVPQSQMVIPVAYDQQLVSMPIYRVGSSLGSLQPVQVLAPLPTGGSSITTA